MGADFSAFSFYQKIAKSLKMSQDADIILIIENNIKRKVSSLKFTWEPFTPKAKSLIVEMGRIWLDKRIGKISPRYLLLAILSLLPDLPNIKRIFDELQIDISSEKLKIKGRKRKTACFDDGLREIIRKAYDISIGRNQPQIGCEHLVFAMVSFPNQARDDLKSLTGGKFHQLTTWLRNICRTN